MSFWGTLGKIALKAAPIAAAFIPGVGPLASMAISGLTSGASSKLSGGSWKDALISGGIGAGAGLAGASAIKGIGPTSGALAKLGGGAAGNTATTGWEGALGNVVGNIGKNAAMSAVQGGESVPSATSSIQQGGHTNPGIGPTSTAIPRTNSPFSQPNQNNPNLADSLSAGRQAAYNGIFGNQRKRLWTPMTDQAVPQNGY